MNFPITENKSPINTSMEKKINPTELESRKVFAKYWSTDGVFYYCMEINNISVCRRSIDSFVNGTKLLNAARLTRGRRDGLLKKVADKFVVRNGIAPLRGVWIPLHVAQDFARVENIEDVSYPLLEENLEDAFKRNPDFVKAINKKMQKIGKKTVSLQNTSELSKTNSADNADDITHSLKESITTESLMKFVKSNQQENSRLNHPYPVDSIIKSNPQAFKSSTSQVDLNSIKDADANFNKNSLDEIVVHKETASSTRVMTPINKIVNASINGVNAASTDITDNSNARTVVNTPHMFGYYSMDSLKPPFDMNLMNAHIYNTTRLNQNNFVYQQPASMFGMPPYAKFPPEEHYKRLYGSPMQNGYMGYIPNPHDKMVHQHPYMMHYINHQKQYEK